jgi:hypothetical protein
MTRRTDGSRRGNRMTRRTDGGRRGNRMTRRTDGGFVSVELVLGLVLLVLPVALLVLTLPTWFARQDLARLAAQQAARQAVIAESGAQGPSMVSEIAANNGLGPGQMTLSWASSSNFAPGGLVTAQVSVRIPATIIPGLGTIGSFTWTATFSERVDQYRSAP